ncbi:MAG: ParM/StbA family protein [Firmicutes bacterium]|nr:ParM/StbA family protein [Bacillota bacterium]
MYLSVDIGYGFTKAVSDAGTQVSFPSAAAPAVTDPLGGVFKDGAGYRVRVSAIGGAEEKLVGDAALQSLAVQGFVAQQEKPQGLHDLLLLTAAYLCGAGTDAVAAGGNTDLAVGLPLSFYRAQKDALKERLSKLSAWVSVNFGRERYVSFGKVAVFPQGAGILVSLGSSLPKSGMVGVIDVGTYTTDFLLFEVRNGFPVPVPEACGSVEAGIHLVHRALAAAFERQTGAPLPARMHQQALERVRNGEEISYRGRVVNLAPAFARAKREAADAIASHVLAAWGDRTGFLSLVALAGGGALLFGEILAGYFPRAVQVPDPVFANALGYLTMLSG